MKKFTLIIALCLALAACGGKKSTTETTEASEAENTRLAEALNVGDLKSASVMADSMSLFVDDFTPEQTVQVLMTFLQVHNDAVANKNTRKDLETLRKYVDVYDIALSVNPSDTRAAFAKAHSLNPEVNFDSIATMFREKLTQYDAVHDGSLNAAEPEVTDSVTVDTAATATVEEIPIELRPAE